MNNKERGVNGVFKTNLTHYFQEKEPLLKYHPVRGQGTKAEEQKRNGVHRNLSVLVLATLEIRPIVNNAWTDKLNSILSLCVRLAGITLS